MSDEQITAQATPAGELRRQILSPHIGKNEREWWAARTIEKLEFELKAANDRIKRLEEALEECDWAFTKFCPEHESRYGDAWEKVRDALNRPNPFKPYWQEAKP